MGLNISGLVIDKNYKTRLTELESILGQKLIFEKEVTFGEALENWKEDSYCDIYFSKKGTFVLLSMEIGGFDFYAKNQIVFSFVLSEMTGMFCVNYTQNDELVRSIMESEEMSENEGEPFEFEGKAKGEDEDEDDDIAGLIFHLIDKTLGESFNDIAFEATCYRYTFEEMEDEGQSTGEEDFSFIVNGLEKKEKSTNPWWKFW